MTPLRRRELVEDEGVEETHVDGHLLPLPPKFICQDAADGRKHEQHFCFCASQS